MDDNEMSTDEIEELTNMLCYLYARCSRSISIPTPVYYAHLAAFRARSHIQAAIELQKISHCSNENRGPRNQQMDYFNASSSQSGRIHFTKHRVPCIDNFDSYVDMSHKMRCSMYFC